MQNCHPRPNMAMRADVVLPAAGTSVRMKMQVAKQFQKVCGHPVLAYTIDAFHRLPWIRHIVVVVDPLQVEHTRYLMDKYTFTKAIVCTGDKTRHRSIFKGVQALKDACESSDVVLIHDAARPFVPEDVVWKVASEAQAKKAAGVTRPLVSTVIRGDDSRTLVESLDRQLYRNSEMPQAFHYGVIAEAYSKCTEYDLDYGTECLLLAMKYAGCAAHLVEGTDDLWKVTYQKDLYAMESIVKEKLCRLTVIDLCSKSPSFATAVESKMCEWPFKMASSKEGSSNTFIVFANCETETSQLDLISLSIVKSCDCLSSACQISLEPFVVVVFVSASTNSGNKRSASETDYQESSRNGTCISSRQTKTTFLQEIQEISTKINNQNSLSCSKSLPSHVLESTRAEKYMKLDGPEESSKLSIRGGDGDHAPEAPSKSQTISVQARSANSSSKSTCLSLLVQVKHSIATALQNKLFTIVGVIVKDFNFSVADRLLSIIRHRSSYLDGQLLDWT